MTLEASFLYNYCHICNICKKHISSSESKGAPRICMEGELAKKRTLICKNCWDTNEKVSQCSECKKKFNYVGDISYQTRDGLFVCHRCNKCKTKCCVCQHEINFNECPHQYIDREEETRSICRKCLNDKDKIYCRDCWGLDADKLVQTGCTTKGPFCSNCYQFELWVCSRSAKVIDLKQVKDNNSTE